MDLTTIFGGGRYAAAAEAMIENLGKLNQKYNQIGQTAKKFGALVIAQALTSAAAWARLKSAVMDVATAFGRDLLPIFVKVVNAVSNAAQWFVGLSASTRHWIEAVGGALAVVGPFLLNRAGISKVVSAMAIGFGTLMATVEGQSAATLTCAGATSTLTGANTTLTGSYAGLSSVMATTDLTMTGWITGIGLAVAAGAGLIYGLDKLGQHFDRTRVTADEMAAAVKLTAMPHSKLTAWAQSTLGGHFYVKAGKITWSPTVTMSPAASDQATHAMIVTIHENAVKVRAAQQEEFIKGQIADAKEKAQAEQMAMALAPKEVVHGKVVGVGPAYAAAQAGYSQAMAVLDKLQTRLKGPFSFQITAKLADAQATLAVWQKRINTLSRQPYSVKVGVQMAKDWSQVGYWTSFIDKYTHQNHTVIVTAEIAAAKKRVAEIQKAIDFLKDHPPKVGFSADLAKLEAALAKAKRDVQDAGGVLSRRLSSAGDDAGAGMALGISAGLTKAKTSVTTQAPKIGLNFSGGLAAGMNAKKFGAGGVVTVALALADAAIAAVNKELGIHSQSTVGFATGMNYASAVAAGIKAGKSKVINESLAVGRSMRGAGGGNFTGGAGNAFSAAGQAYMRSIMPRGWSLNDWDQVMRMESGGSMTARNPSSGAYGIAQFIQGPSEYAKWGGNAETLQGQIYAMMRYMKSRYGSSQAALAHEEAYHWYGQGGDFIARRPQLIGVGDRGPERVSVSPLGTRLGGDQFINQIVWPNGLLIGRLEDVAEELEPIITRLQQIHEARAARRWVGAN